MRTRIDLVGWEKAQIASGRLTRSGLAKGVCEEVDCVALWVVAHRTTPGRILNVGFSVGLGDQVMPEH